MKKMFIFKADSMENVNQVQIGEIKFERLSAFHKLHLSTYS